VLHTPEVPISNLGLETGYSDWGFLWFSSVLQAIAEIVPLIRPRPLPSKFFSIRHSLIILLFDAV
jgi:hypothetical protein